MVGLTGCTWFHPSFSLLNSCIFQWISSWRWHDRLHQASLFPLTLSCLTDRYQQLQACKETVLRLCASFLCIVHEQHIRFLYSLSSFRARSRFPPDLRFPGNLYLQTPLGTLLLCRCCPALSHQDTTLLQLLLPASALLLLLYLQGEFPSRVCFCSLNSLDFFSVKPKVWFYRAYTLIDHFNRNTYTSAHSYSYVISQSCNSSAMKTKQLQVKNFS